MSLAKAIFAKFYNGPAKNVNQTASR